MLLTPVPTDGPSRQSSAPPAAACEVGATNRAETVVGLILCESQTALVLRADPSITSRVLVVEVSSGSRAERAGFKAGDVIHRVAGETVTDVKPAATAIDAHADAGELLINFWRDGHPNLIRLFRE